MNFFDKFVTYLTPARLEGFLLFAISTIIMLAFQLHHRKEWTYGLKGDNGRWEGPEVLLYILMLMFPPMVFADIFLQMRLSEIVWYIYLALIAFCLLGRWGLEWLLAFKTGASQVTSTTIEKEKVKETITQQ